MKQLDFNVLDNYINSDVWTRMSEQVLNGIKTMQTQVPQYGIQPHVVLPVFQQKEEANYVLACNGEQRGPFTESQVRNLYKAGAINGEFYIWTQGMPEWKKIKDCPNILTLL